MRKDDQNKKIEIRYASGSNMPYKNPEKRRENLRKWLRENPEKVKAYRRREIMAYAVEHGSMPTKTSCIRYTIGCDELSQLFVGQINTRCCTTCATIATK